MPDALVMVAVNQYHINMINEVTRPVALMFLVTVVSFASPYYLGDDAGCRWLYLHLQLPESGSTGCGSGGLGKGSDDRPATGDDSDFTIMATGPINPWL